MLALARAPEGFLLGVRVTPGAKRTRVQGTYGDRLKVMVAAPPEDNRANVELIAFLAAGLGLPRDYVSVQAGHKSRDKVLLLRGVEEGELRARLERVAGAGEQRGAHGSQPGT